MYNNSVEQYRHAAHNWRGSSKWIPATVQCTYKAGRVGGDDRHLVVRGLPLLDQARIPTDCKLHVRIDLQHEPKHNTSETTGVTARVGQCE